MKNKFLLSSLLTTCCLLFIFHIAVFCQEAEVKKYAKDGISFDYPDGWEIKDETVTGQRRIALAQAATDAQLLITILINKLDEKQKLEDLKKQVVDPWLNQLVAGYEQAGIKMIRSPITREMPGQSIEGVELKFFFDGQPGRAEACWMLMEQRLILFLFIRPDSQAEKAAPGWETIRQSLSLKDFGKG